MLSSTSAGNLFLKISPVDYSYSCISGPVLFVLQLSECENVSVQFCGTEIIQDAYSRSFEAETVSVGI